MERLQEPSRGKCFTNCVMDALFFSDAVYSDTPEAVVSNLTVKIGKVDHLMDYGFDEDGKQAVFVGRSSNGHIIVACRGTAGIRDLLQDLKYLHARLSYAKGKAHWGFAERAQSVPIDFFCRLLGAGEDIVFTGHSLGGAVASLLGLRVLESSGGLHQEQVQCITFGSPLFASRSLADLINSRYKDVFVHVVSKKDVVPRILPFVSAVQKLLYANEDQLEGFSVLKRGLESLNWLPFRHVLTAFEQQVPPLIKFLMRCMMRLAMPSEGTGSYAFAGHVWMVDANSNAQSLLRSTSANDLNLWHSQLGFALGVSLNASVAEHHAISSYYEGVVGALSQVLLHHKCNTEDDGEPQRTSIDSSSVYRSSQCPTENGALAPRESRKDFNTSSLMTPTTLCPKRFSEGICPKLQGPLESSSCDIVSDSQQTSICNEDICCNCRPSPEFMPCFHNSGHASLSKLQASKRVGTLLLQNQSSHGPVCKAGRATMSSASSKSDSMAKFVGTSKALMRRLGCCAAALRLFIPFSWERISTGARMQEVHAIYVKPQIVSGSMYPNHCRQSVLVKFHKSGAVMHASVHSSKSEFEHFESKSEQILSKTSDSSLHFVATCEVQKVLLKKTSLVAQKKGLGFRWIVATIGRVARHLRALDNLCLFTFIGTILSNLHG